MTTYTVIGRMKGTVRAAGKVRIARMADVRGEITAKSFAIDAGAVFNGNIARAREPNQKLEIVEHDFIACRPS